MGSYARGGSVEVVETNNVEGFQSEPRIAVLADGGWVVVFDNLHVDQEGFNVSQQRYDANGNRVGTETIVNTTGSGNQNDAKVVGLVDGGWVVSWTSNGQDGDGDGIEMQRFDSHGAPVGVETRVNTTVLGNQNSSVLTALSDGGWVVAFGGENIDSGGYAIAQQRYDLNGNPVGGQTLVNTTTADQQTLPAITSLNDGGWLVTWESFSQDAAGTYGVYGQRYDSTGMATGGEFLINSTVAGTQDAASVTALADGGWVVTWESDDGSSTGIFQQRFGADGGRIGSEMLVNTTTENYQYNAQVTSLADGGWVVAWSDLSTGDYTLTQQRFDSAGNRVGGESSISSPPPGSGSDQASIVGLDDGSWVTAWRFNNGVQYDVVQRHFALDVTGTAGSDNLTGTHWDETLIGYGGNDVLNGGLGDDILIGGAGDDTYIINSPGDDIQEVAGQGYDTVKSSIGFSMANDATEALILLGTANINGSGNAADNVITGNSGNNILSGGNGNDVINGGSGNDDLRGGNGNDILSGGPSSDKIDGGAGIDTVSYSDAAAGVTFSLAITTAQNTVGSGTELVINVENVIGSAFADHLTGSSGNNVIEGGAGNDVLNGGLGIDTASYASSTAGVNVTLASTAAQNTGGAGTDTLSGFENLTGSAFNDYLTGDANANVIEGGRGDDVINGGAGSDTASYASATAGVWVDLSLTSWQNTFGAGMDSLSQIESLLGSQLDDNLKGNTGNNRLDGGAGNDFLSGNAGNDVIIGGAGLDVMVGGAGADIFRFAPGDTGIQNAQADHIQDFNQSQHDSIDLHAIDANTFLANDQAFSFVGTAAFSNTAGELRYYTTASETYIQGDMNGDGLADMTIMLVGVYALNASDFSL